MSTTAKSERPEQIDFNPPEHIARQQRIQRIQQDCFGYCAPELKKNTMCQRHHVEVLRQIAEAERERIALYAERRGFHTLAGEIRRLN